MASVDFLSARRLAFRIVLYQAGATLLMAAVFLLLSGFRGGYSALLGGTIGVVASLYMAAWFFRGGESATPRQIMRSIYIGEFVKLVVTVAMFVAVFVWVTIAALPLFAGYAATFLMYWVALLRAMPQGQGGAR